MPRRPLKRVYEVGEAGDGNISSFTARLQAKFGKDTVSFLTGDMISEVKDWVSTQNPMLDLAIGHPGLPVGRVVSIIGETSSGKTTQCYHLFAETQRRGGIAILIDAESAALDAKRARELGVIPEQLLVLQPETVEEACTMMQQAIEFAREDHPDRIVTIIFDSVAGLGTKAEVDGEFGAHHMAGHARVMGQALRKLVRLIADQKILLVLVNQYRDNVGVTFGPSKTMIAERPIRFASSVIIEIAKVGPYTKGEGEKKVSLGINCRATVQKNKTAKPFEIASFRILWDRGIDTVNGLFNLGVAMGVIERPSAGWYQIGERKFRESEFEDVLASTPTITSQILSLLELPEVYPAESAIASIGFPELAEAV
jgi:recombination protein RecA